ncbi:decapping 5-like protein [Vigna radiata var. radiata]|uniref:Decapping 5-like protein n=1 Tax=Vigna radiata var. radiata TaxID=3916 RepID=A0A1S3VN30_VIGRR|nr:decapping 5-like protein [Vigna radiata var. radiata]XP_022643254.1 decapping 5-like protein [Vigna radiata var. radiata]
MASDFGANGPSTSPSNSAESFIGCFISLISKCEIRYEGVLYLLDVQDSTIGLKNVKSYGTEGRRKDGTQIPPSDKVYEYILFRGSDIKNLKIKSPSTSSKSEEQVLSDPAIIQSRYSGSPSSPVASVGGRNLTESIQRQDTPEISSKPFPVGLPSYQLVTELGPSNSSVATQVASHPSFSSAMSWQGPSDVSSSGSNSLLQSSSLYSPSMAASVVVQNQIKNEETQLPTKGGWTSFSERGLPMSSAMTSSLVNLTHLHSLTSLKNSDSLDIPSLTIPVPYSASMTFDGSNMPQFSSPYQDICADPRPIHPRHSAPSFVDSTSGLLPTTPFLLTPDQFANPREQLLSTTHNLNPNQKGMCSLTQASLVPFPASQAPLLPLPTSVQKPQYTAPQFTEEFDFEAMNEKFRKDEVWGSLGKATTKIEGVQDNLNPGNMEYHGMVPNHKSAYKKDDFFDTISCNSLTRGSRNGQNRFSERMKQDTETFGNFQQRHNFNYGAGRGENFRGSYNWGGRGYGYGGRGRGPNFPL